MLVISHTVAHYFRDMALNILLQGLRKDSCEIYISTSEMGPLIIHRHFYAFLTCDLEF